MTRKAFVVGHPIKHSRSPAHPRLLAERVRARRLLRARSTWRPHGFRPPFCSPSRRRGFAGGNVTIPHKEAAFAAVRSQTDRAPSACEAVNTLWFEDGVLWGDNTDVPGFLANLDQTRPGWDDAGRTLRSCSAPAARRGPSSRACRSARSRDRASLNRTLARAARRWRATSASAVRRSRPSLGGLRPCLPGADLLVNTTSLGMAGQPPLDLDLAAPRRDAVVTDIVYVPLETPLLAAAARARPAHRRRPRHAAAPGGAGLRALVRRDPGGDAGAARADRGRHRRTRDDASCSASPARSAWASPPRRRCSGEAACRCTTPTRRCIALYRGRGRSAGRGRRFRARARTARSTGRALGAHGAGRSDGHDAAGGDRASAGPRRGDRASSSRAAAAGRRSSCSTSRCCSRPAARRAATRSSSSPRRLLCKRRVSWPGRA